MRSLISFLWVLVAVVSLRAADEAAHPVAALGTPLPAFSLPGADGATYTPASFAGAKVLAVIFTCNHCPTAQAYEGRIQALATDYASRGVQVVAVNPNSPRAVRLDELGYTDLDDTLADMKIRAKDKGFTFPYLDDGETEAFSRQLGPVATPHVFVFDVERKLRYQGRIDDSEREDLVKRRDTRAAIDALLAGRAPEVAQTKVFGCSTKWEEKAEGNTRWMEKVKKEPVKLETADAAALRDLRANKSGKVRLINAWATWCGPCVSEFDELVETNLRFRHREFELVTVAAQFPDERPKVEKFLQQHHASMRNLMFAGNDKYPLLEALDPEWNGALPHTLLIGVDGKVLYRETGELDFVKLRRKIVAALNAVHPWKPATAAE